MGKVTIKSYKQLNKKTNRLVNNEYKKNIINGQATAEIEALLKGLKFRLGTEKHQFFLSLFSTNFFSSEGGSTAVIL